MMLFSPKVSKKGRLSRSGAPERYRFSSTSPKLGGGTSMTLKRMVNGSDPLCQTAGLLGSPRTGLARWAVGWKGDVRKCAYTRLCITLYNERVLCALDRNVFVLLAGERERERRSPCLIVANIFGTRSLSLSLSLLCTMSAANFAPFRPSPDERQQALASSAAAPHVPHVTANVNEQRSGLLGKEALGRASLDADFDPRYATESYQSSMPSASKSGPSQDSLGASQPTWTAAPSSSPSYAQSRPQPGSGARPDHLSYSTAQGWSLSSLCLAAWALPPFTSVLLLIYETENDLVRFHAYQAGMFGVAATVSLWILRSIFGWYTLSIIVGMGMLGYAWVCGSNAANAAPTLARSPFLAVLGPLAEQWVGEE